MDRNNIVLVVLIFASIYFVMRMINCSNENLDTSIPIDVSSLALEKPKELPKFNKKGTTDSVYHEHPEKPTVFATTCIDLRFIDEEQGFLEYTYGKDYYDSFVLPGAALALYDKSPDLTKPDLLDETFYNAWIKSLLIAAALHGIKIISIVDHEDCDYYKKLYITENGFKYNYDIIVKNKDDKINLDATKNKYESMVKSIYNLITPDSSTKANSVEFDPSESNSIMTTLPDPNKLTEDDLSSDNVKSIIKIWQKYIHKLTMTDVIEQLKSTLPRKTATLINSTGPTLDGADLLANNMTIDGYLMKMDGTAEKLYSVIY